MTQSEAEYLYLFGSVPVRKRALVRDVACGHLKWFDRRPWWVWLILSPV